jgi:hypothetical protein
MSLLLALLLQTPPALPAPSPSVSIERVKRALDRPAIRFDQPPPEVPVFRVEARKRTIWLESPWKDHSVTPVYVQPQMPITHYDFLMSVTPEEFRAATLYPCCIDLVPVFEFLFDQATGAGRLYRQSRAKRTVTKALNEIGVVKKHR